MKRHVTLMGRKYDLTASEKKALCKAIAIVDEIAYFRRDDNEGTAAKALGEQLQFLVNGESLVDEVPPEE